MSKTATDAKNDRITVEQWLAIGKEAGLNIDPQTAEVMWDYRLILDPYGVCPDLPEEYQTIGRVYFARSPGSEIWVDYGDLPVKTLAALRGSEQERRSLKAYDAMFNDMDWLFEGAE